MSTKSKCKYYPGGKTWHGKLWSALLWVEAQSQWSAVRSQKSQYKWDQPAGRAASGAIGCWLFGPGWKATPTGYLCFYQTGEKRPKVKLIKIKRTKRWQKKFVKIYTLSWAPNSVTCCTSWKVVEACDWSVVNFWPDSFFIVIWQFVCKMKIKSVFET